MTPRTYQTITYKEMVTHFSAVYLFQGINDPGRKRTQYVRAITEKDSGDSLTAFHYDSAFHYDFIGARLERAANLYPDGISGCAVDSIFIQAAQSHRGGKIFWTTNRISILELNSNKRRSSSTNGLYVDYPEYNKRLVGPITSTCLKKSRTDSMLNMLKTGPRTMAIIMNVKNPAMSGSLAERVEWTPHVLK